MKIGYGKTHGKIILMGEHAVVYNYPCIALPFFDASVTTTVTEDTTQRLTCDFYDGLFETMPELMSGLKKVVLCVLEALHHEHTNLHITIESTIPIERGMGSSAAVAGSVVKALFNYFEVPLSHEQLLHFIGISETITHGKPSGIDALTTTSTEAVYFIRNQAPQPIVIDMYASLIVADTGEMGKTREAVASIQQKLDQPEVQHHLHSIGQCTTQARQAMENHQPIVLGQLMNEVHHHLDALGVSSASLNQLVNLANHNGALGSKLTGGGRGGCMIALCKPEDEQRIVQALQQQATHVWSMSLKGE